MLGFLGKEGNKASGEAVDTVAIIAVRSRGESTMVTVRFEGRIWRELTGFADEKGMSRGRTFFPCFSPMACRTGKVST